MRPTKEIVRMEASLRITKYPELSTPPARRKQGLSALSAEVESLRR
jgi:hypothetical protein